MSENYKMSPSEMIGNKMLELLSEPRAARLQATVIAMACMGVYSPPFSGVEIAADDLVLCTDLMEVQWCFPLLTLTDCVSAFNWALEFHAANAEIDGSRPSD